MTIRQADITRAIRGARAAGLDVERVEVTRDGVVVYPRRDGEPEPQDAAKAWLEANR